MKTNDIILTILVLIVAVAILYGLSILQARHLKFSKRVLIAMAIGIVFGIGLQLIFGTKGAVTTESLNWLNVVGNGYIALLRMLVTPIIFVSIVAAFTRLKVSENLRKIGSTVIVTLLATTAIAALIGVGSVLLFHLNGANFPTTTADKASLASLATHQSQVSNLSIPEQLVSFIPENFFADLAGTRATSTIGVVIFSTFIGIAYLGVKRKTPETGEFFEKIIDALYKITLRIVTLVLRLTPYGIFALMVKATAASEFKAILNLGTFIIAVYVALIAMFLVESLIIVLSGESPLTYFKKAFPALSFAFTSRSSAGTLPLNINTQTNALGIDEATANFSGSFGLTIGQNGCAGIYPAMLAAIIAPTVGINVTNPAYILTIVGVVTISSLGVAGVGGGAIFAALIVLGTLNLPVALMGVIIAIDPIIDMGRTMLNVSDTMIAGLITSKRIKTFDKKIYENPEKVIQTDI